MMEMTRQERIELHDKLVAMLDGVRRELKARFPEIISVDLGLKERRGTLTQEFSWRVFVNEKKAEGDLRPEDTIPREVAGLPTDVQVVRMKLQQEADEASYSSLAGGIQITARGGTGTLGCFVTVGAGTTIHLLSNHHVLIGDGATSGGLVGQPSGACDLCCCKCCDIAVVVNGVVGVAGNVPTNKVDAAIALLRGQTPGDTKIVPYANRVIDIGPIFGSGTVIPTDIVRKRGRTSLLQTGIVASVTEEPNVNIGTPDNVIAAKYHDCIEITPQTVGTPFSEGGDSGSAIINAMGQVVGLIFSGLPASSSGCKIGNISTSLGGITVLTSGTAATIPHAGYTLEIPVAIASPANFLTKIEHKLKETTCGKEFLNAIHENRREVLDLINDNREVKVAWNRFQGPAFVGHFAKNANEPGHQIPADVNGYSLQNLLIKMNDVLERNGSRKLAKAVDEYAQSAYLFASEYAGLDSIDGILNRGDYCPKCGTLKNGMHYA